MKNSKGFGVVGVLIIITVLVIGGGAYYIGKNSKQENKLPVVENNLPNLPEENQIVNNVKADCLPSTDPWIKVLSPNGGETYIMGQTIDIRWKTCNAQTGETISLSIGKEIPASKNNGISGAFSPSVSFYPLKITNDGIENVTLSGSSTNGNWPFTSGNNYKISAVLNPLATNTQETPFVQDMSDGPFTINSVTSTSLPQYISAQSGWPLVIQYSSTTYSCSVGIGNKDIDQQTIQKVINGKTYCISSSGDGAAGSIYETYVYKTSSGAGTKTTTFTLKYVSCGVYGGPGDKQYNECKSSQNTFFNNIDRLVDSVFTIRKEGETCGEGIGSCQTGLKCFYPCGVSGCQSTCVSGDPLPRP